MPDIYGSHFEFGGRMSRTYNLWIANISTKRFLQLHGRVDGVTVYNRAQNKRHLVGNSYSNSPVSFDVEIITLDGHGLEKDERREIEKWLFQPNMYQKLYIDVVDDPDGEFSEMIDGERKRLYLNCRFTNPEKIEFNGGIIGYQATLETDSGYWWQDPVTKTFTLNQSDSQANTISFFTDTDIAGFTFPRVTIVVGAQGGAISLTNVSSGSYANAITTNLTNTTPGSTIILDGSTGYINGSNYQRFLGWRFPRIYDGENVFQVAGSVNTISFKFQNRRMF